MQRRCDLSFEWAHDNSTAGDCMRKTLINSNILWCYNQYHQIQADIYHSGKESALTYFNIEGDTFGICTVAQWRAIKAIRSAGVDSVFVRPTYRGFGIYHSIGVNRAEVLFEALTKDECDDAIKITRIWGDKEVDY